MLKRWADWPPGIRWLVGIAAVVLALAVVWALFVPVADWLAHHDVGSAKAALHETAVDNARGRLLTLGAGLFAAGALVFTARNFTLSRRTFELTEQGQVTDRYTKAIKQLGSKNRTVRTGGIYALERVARDSKRDHPTVMEVLTAFIREPPNEPPPDLGRPGARSTRPDVQAAVIVVGRRDPKRDLRRIDLGGASLTGARLSRANLSRAYLGYADLTNAKFSGADLTGADFTNANLTGADFTPADPTESDPNPKPANLTGAILTDAQWSQESTAPAGWIRDPGSGLLRRAISDADDTGN